MNLTHRQKQVVSGTAASFTAKEIGTILNVSDKAVDYHRAKAKVRIIESRTLLGICGSETDALFTHYALKHKLITIHPSISFLGRTLVSVEVDYCYLTDPVCLAGDGDFCSRPPGNYERRNSNLGQAPHSKRRCLAPVLHNKRRSTGHELASSRYHHKPSSNKRRSTTGVHKSFARSRGVLFHDGS